MNQRTGDGSSGRQAARVRPRRAGSDAAGARVCFQGRRGHCGGSAPRLRRLEDSVTIRLRLSEPVIADDLASFLSRHDCHAEVAEDGMVTVELPHLLHRDQARMELELYIRLWQALRGVSITISSSSS